MNRMGKWLDGSNDLFQKTLVDFVKGVEISAVDVEDGNDLVVADDGNNNLTVGG